MQILVVAIHSVLVSEMNMKNTSLQAANRVLSDNNFRPIRCLLFSEIFTLSLYYIKRLSAKMFHVPS